MGSSPRVRLLVGLGLALMLGACTGGLVRADDRLIHPRHGGSIADLAQLDPSWHEIEVEGATLAYRDVDGALAAWVRECRGAGDVDRLAQALLFEWQARPLSREEAEFHGAPGVRLHAESDTVELRSMTRAGPACSDDWFLVTRGPAGPRAELLERWVASFDPGHEDAAHEEPRRD
jgi:hypothetical protein